MWMVAVNNHPVLLLIMKAFCDMLRMCRKSILQHTLKALFNNVAIKKKKNLVCIILHPTSVSGMV